MKTTRHFLPVSCAALLLASVAPATLAQSSLPAAPLQDEDVFADLASRFRQVGQGKTPGGYSKLAWDLLERTADWDEQQRRTGQAATRISAPGEPVNTTTANAARARRAESFLQAWSDLAAAKDAAYDPNDRKYAYYLNVAPPMPPGGPGKQICFSGMAPESVVDPEQRAAYKALIAANGARARYAEAQIDVRRAETLVLRAAQIYFPCAYAAREAAHIGALLKQHGIDAHSATRVLESIREHDSAAAVHAG